MSEKSATELFAEYHQKIEEFLKFDELNLKDTQMTLPATRHYWVGRLMFHKQQAIKLKKAKEKAAKVLRQKLENDSPIGLTTKTINDSISQNEVMLKLEEEIVNNELLIEYLTKVGSKFKKRVYPKPKYSVY